MIQDLKNHCSPPSISFKPDLAIGIKHGEMWNSLKVDMKTFPGEKNRKIVFLYISIFNNSFSKAPLKFLFILKKIIKVNNLTKVSQCYAMTKNLMAREALHIFHQKAR